jgi:hypothetical protein
MWPLAKFPATLASRSAQHKIMDEKPLHPSGGLRRHSPRIRGRRKEGLSHTPQNDSSPAGPTAEAHNGW